ncbi:CoA transferase [Albimonas sp. CAU 1670]|uniref:CaiB/BaiF CoA transferase family protein n=1 Tax=Albimonas sp. CAU 1670 TaxID=3032599 RepID=UPI0023DCD5F6|nr:CoA transferase [Albimonas sp. CAU 1670]MDF2235674.1 CoA transferase [Albimonas sp. CAU 1670]
MSGAAAGAGGAEARPRPSPARPLAGVRVLDFTAIVLGPLATRCLADLGAEVVKVEGPAGDGIRHSAAVPAPGMGSIYMALNSGKKSIALDLKAPGAQEILRRLTAWADVAVHNMRPASARALGLDAATMTTANPRLIHCSASGFAQDGPRADDPAVDDVIQAASGLADLFGRAGDAPRYVPSVIADKVCGLLMGQAILAGLFQRETTGQGMAVEIPMAETMSAFVLLEHMGAAAFPDRAPDGPAGYGRLLTPHRRPFRTRDGYVALTPYTKRDWQAFLRAAGAPELAEHPRVVDPVRRNAEVAELYAALAGILLTRDTETWIRIGRETGIPAAAIRPLDEVAADPDLARGGWLREVETPDLGRVRVPGPLLRLPAGAAPAQSAPALGRDGAEVLEALGFDAAERAAFIRDGVVAGEA